MAEWFRSRVLQSAGPGFKASTLSLVGFVSRYSRVQVSRVFEIIVSFILVECL